MKLFPAGPIGGVPFLKALAGPYPMVRYVPTGGITIGNLGEYLAVPQVVACGGTWLVRADMIRAGGLEAIGTLARNAVEVVREARRGAAETGAGS